MNLFSSESVSGRLETKDKLTFSQISFPVLSDSGTWKMAGGGGEGGSRGIELKR